MLVLVIFWRTLDGIVGGYVTAALASSHPVRHAVILGGIGLVFGTLGSIANWDKAVASGTWYPIALVLLTLPGVWLGGVLGKGNRSLGPEGTV